MRACSDSALAALLQCSSAVGLPPSIHLAGGSSRTQAAVVPVVAMVEVVGAFNLINLRAVGQFDYVRRRKDDS